MRPIQVPKGSEDWELLNELMPTPCYPSGSSVAGALIRSKGWKSTGDLQALAAGSSPAQGAGLSAGRGPSGQGLASLPPPPAAKVAAAMRKSASHSSLSLAEAAAAQIQRSAGSLSRRRSAAVGELSRLLAAPAAGAAKSRDVHGGPLRVAAVPPPRRGPLLPALAEHAAAGAAAAGAAAAALPLPNMAGRSPGAVLRSKSLSVEDAVEVLARGPPLPDLPRRNVAPRGQGAAAPPAAAQHNEGPQSVPPITAAPASPPILPGVALSAPAVTAQVQLQPANAAAAIAGSAGGGGGAKQQAEQPVGQQTEQHPGGEEGKKAKTTTLWKALRGKA
ncbi:hypothetical protein ABPG75_011860 [Micractinium tetrahymenae]